MNISQRMFLKPTNMLVFWVFLIRLYIALLHLATIFKHTLQNVILALPRPVKNNVNGTRIQQCSGISGGPVGRPSLSSFAGGGHSPPSAVLVSCSGICSKERADRR